MGLRAVKNRYDYRIKQFLGSEDTMIPLDCNILTNKALEVGRPDIEI